MLCAELIGRRRELQHLTDQFAMASDPRGGVVAVVGPAGSGKSRLVHEAIRSSGTAVSAGAARTDAARDDDAVVVLTGRALPAENPAPYRPLAEAFLAAARGRALPPSPSLAGFEAHLGRLVPSWGAGGTADDSPVLLAEGLVRVLDVLSAERPHVVVLEDLHWADPETLAVVEYLSEALREQATRCVVTLRPEARALDVVARLRRRDPTSVIPLDPLDGTGVDAMVAACLVTDEPPAGLADFMQQHSDGNPFLVEELLAGLVASGTLVASDHGWEIAGPLTPAVPASLRDSIGHRLGRFDTTTRRVLGAASLLGRMFEWDLLPGIADVDGRTAAEALRAAVDAQLVEVDGDGFRFRHALTREAILDDLLPPDRRELATRAWPAIERAHPGLPGPVCQLAADLAEAAGDRVAAATRLVECAHRALGTGAMATAEATARRARILAVDDPAVAIDADEELLHVLAAAGKPAEALTLGRRLVAELAEAGAPVPRRVDLLVAVARAAITAGELDAAQQAADDARAVIGPDVPGSDVPGSDVPEPHEAEGPVPTASNVATGMTTASGAGDRVALEARIDTVAATVALDREDLAGAQILAERAIEGARSTHQTDVLCEALLTYGRLLRPQGLDRSRRVFAEAAEVAEAAGLARWHLRAQQELALDDLEQFGSAPLRTTRDLAARYGAHLTVAVMDMAMADLALSDYDAERCRASASACIDASRRFHLATEPVAHLWLAGAHALDGDDDGMQREIDAALARDPDDPRILADVYGRVLATRAFVRDELDTLPDLMEQMMVHVRRGPLTTSVYPGRIVWALLHSVDGDDLGLAAREELRTATAAMGLSVFVDAADLCDAVALARSGDPEGATDAAVRPYTAMVHGPVGQGMVRAAVLVVARAAIRDGWGEPARWLRESEAWFAERRFDALVRRCRTMLAEAGAPVPRQGRGESAVPATLRGMGVTSREVDVLKLVVAGRTNKEIAAALYLSPKTVERHLSSLFDRTGVRNRAALAEVGADHLPDTP